MKKKILLSLFAYFFLALSMTANGQGGTLPLNGSINGNLTSATPDVWDVTTNADGLLRLTFTTVSPADLYVTLYDNDGTTVVGNAVESFNNSTATLSVDGLATGTYHAKITPFSAGFGSYTLADSLFTSALANDAEPNGAQVTALTLNQNSKMTGHVGYYYNNLRDTADWYKVTTSADGLLRVYLSTERSSVYSTNPLDINLTIYDNDGATQLAAVEVFNGNNPVTNFATVDGLAPGTYYIKVQPYSTNEFADYTISDTLFTTPVANDVEPNGTGATAVTLPVNNKKTGHLGYYYNNQRDSADWYKVTTTAEGLLRVYLSTERGSVYSSNNLDVNVWLYDNDGTTQLGNVEVFNGNNPASNLITADGLAPSTYYIKVKPYSTNEFANYTISDTLFTTTLANDVEPNGTAATAVALPVNSKKTGHIGYYYNDQRDSTDWYKVTTNADGLLRVYLSTERGGVYSSNSLDVNVWLYDNDGTTQLGNVEVFNGNNPASNLITADGLEPGTYYIKIKPYSTNEFANYTISDSLFLPSIPNDAEPNGTSATALDLPLNSYLKGHSGYYYKNQRDTADWYKITIPADGPLHIYLRDERGSIYSNNTLDILFTVYNSDGTTQIGSREVFNGGAPGVDSLSFASLAAGTYFVKVNNYSTNEFADYSLTISSTAGGLLPVTFINFDGTLNDAKALLKWSTASEVNNKGFEVEKSSDGQTFVGIGFVAGNSTSSLVKNYNFTDIKVLSGSNYYRLKQVDIDGNFNYSSTIRLDFKHFDWAIFGNPISSNSWIQLQVANTSKIAFQVYTVDGKLLKTIDRGTLSEGTYSVPLRLGNAPAGIYIIKLVSGNQTFSKEIIK